MRRHVSRHHDFKITTVSTSQMPFEQKRRLKNLADKESKRHKAKERHRPLFDIHIATYHGAFGCTDPIVVYKKSSIPKAGNGVFATTDIKKGDIITIYSGEMVDGEPIDSEYAIKLQDGSYVIGNSTPKIGHGLGSFMSRESRQMT